MDYIYPNYIFIILIVLFTGLLAVISSKGNLLDFRYKNLKKIIKIKGWYFIIISLLYGTVLIFQNYNNKRQQLVIEKEKRTRDSIIAHEIKKGVDSASIELFEKLSKAFSKQSLKIDSLKNEIIVLKDSVKTTNNYYQSLEQPVIQLHNNALKIIDSISSLRQYELRLSVKNAGITNININIDVISYFKDNSYYTLRMYPTPNSIKVAKNSGLIKMFEVPTTKEPMVIYFHIHGSFTNLNKRNVIKIDDYYAYVFKTNKLRIPLVDLRERIVNSFKSKFKKE